MIILPSARSLSSIRLLSVSEGWNRIIDFLVALSLFIYKTQERNIQEGLNFLPAVVLLELSAAPCRVFVPAFGPFPVKNIFSFVKVQQKPKPEWDSWLDAALANSFSYNRRSIVTVSLPVTAPRNINNLAKFQWVRNWSVVFTKKMCTLLTASKSHVLRTSSCCSPLI